VSGPRLALLDYGAGNLRSAQRGLERAGAEIVVTDDPEHAGRCDGVVVPGVGHVASCLAGLREAGLATVVVGLAEQQRPVLGICVGMQLLYEHSEEGDTEGLGVVPGRVVRLPDERVRVPHMGWNVVAAAGGHDADPLLEGVAGERCFFVHSYRAEDPDADEVIATSTYPDPFPAIVRSGSVVASQFHPEKSGDVGARFLRNWVRTAA
jgi:imidazole glycerol-phosphate synthase subunit HisH